MEKIEVSKAVQEKWDKLEILDGLKLSDKDMSLFEPNTKEAIRLEKLAMIKALDAEQQEKEKELMKTIDIAALKIVAERLGQKAQSAFETKL